MVWFFLWLVLAVAIIMLTFWTYFILLKQKGAWKTFAERHKLQITSTGFTSSPQIEGYFKDLALQIFSERQVMPDGRGHQYRTIIQFVLHPNMPTEGVIASRYFTPFVTNLGLPKKWPMPKGMKWKEEPLARAGIATRLKTFMTQDRIKALEILSNLQKSNFVFIFDETDAYLRVESPDPIDDDKRMDNIVKKIYSIAEILCVKEEEIDEFNKLANREERVDARNADDDDEDADDFYADVNDDSDKVNETASDIEPEEKPEKEEEAKDEEASKSKEDDKAEAKA